MREENPCFDRCGDFGSSCPRRTASRCSKAKSAAGSACSPVDHWYNEADGKLYFHGAKEGHRLDAIAREPKASYCVIDAGVQRENDWSKDFKSVIVFGRMELVEDEARVKDALLHLTLKFTDASYFDEEWRKVGARVRITALVPEHISGKRVNES